MSDLDDLMAQIPMDQLAAQLGVGEQEAAAATRAALPALLGGLQANAQDPGGEASLRAALGQHGAELDDGVDLGAIDTADGSRIVDHIFGDHREQVVDRLAGARGGLGDLLGGDQGGGGGGLLSKLLPLLAPIVLAWLSKKITGGGTPTSPADAKGTGGGGGLGDILGDLLGGAGGGAAGSGGGITDILGDLLGGGRRA